MALAAQPVTRAPASSSLYDVLDLILDKGLVIDAYVRVSLIGIEILTIDARIVVASVDTYLRFAEAVNRLDLRQQSDAQDLGDLTSGMMPDAGEAGEAAGDAAKGAAESALPDSLQNAAQKLGLLDEDEEEGEEQEQSEEE